MLRKIKAQFASLEELKNYVESKDQAVKCSIEVDQWVDTMVKAANKCLVVKQSATAGAKIVIVGPDVIATSPIAPGTFFNSFRRGVFAVVLDLIIAPAQNKVAQRVDGWMKEIEN